MPPAEIIFFRDEDGSIPIRDWLAELQRRNRRAFAKCVTRIRRLAEMGYELRRPETDFLRDGIYELRIRDESVNYRILYFFHGQNVCILAHALTKEDKVPDVDIERALRYRERFEQDPEAHTHYE